MIQASTATTTEGPTGPGRKPIATTTTTAPPVRPSTEVSRNSPGDYLNKIAGLQLKKMDRACFLLNILIYSIFEFIYGIRLRGGFT